MTKEKYNKIIRTKYYETIADTYNRLPNTCNDRNNIIDKLSNQLLKILIYGTNMNTLDKNKCKDPNKNCTQLLSIETQFHLILK